MSFVWPIVFELTCAKRVRPTVVSRPYSTQLPLLRVHERNVRQEPNDESRGAPSVRSSPALLCLADAVEMTRTSSSARNLDIVLPTSIACRNRPICIIRGFWGHRQRNSCHSNSKPVSGKNTKLRKSKDSFKGPVHHVSFQENRLGSIPPADHLSFASRL